MDEIFGPMQRAVHMILHLLQYPQIGNRTLNSRVVKNVPRAYSTPSKGTPLQGAFGLKVKWKLECGTGHQECLKTAAMDI